LEYARIHKPIPEKKVAKTSLSPTSYHVNESFMKTKINKPKVSISKYKIGNFIEKEINSKKWVPGPSAYKFSPRGESMITKGASKGWK